VSGLFGNPVTGAIDAVAPHPEDANIIYIGTRGGGIWKTTNALHGVDFQDNNGDGEIDEADEGIQWTPLTDQLPSASISELVFDPFDISHQTLFAATAEVNSPLRGAPNNQTGLLRTIDGGETWHAVQHPTVLGKTVTAITPTASHTDA